MRYFYFCFLLILVKRFIILHNSYFLIKKIKALRKLNYPITTYTYLRRRSARATFAGKIWPGVYACAKWLVGSVVSWPRKEKHELCLRRYSTYIEEKSTYCGKYFLLVSIKLACFVCVIHISSFVHCFYLRSSQPWMRGLRLTILLLYRNTVHTSSHIIFITCFSCHNPCAETTGRAADVTETRFL